MSAHETTIAAGLIWVAIVIATILFGPRVAVFIRSGSVSAVLRKLWLGVRSLFAVVGLFAMTLFLPACYLGFAYAVVYGVSFLTGPTLFAGIRW